MKYISPLFVLLICLSACSADTPRVYNEHFLKGMNAYRQKDFSNAVTEFEACLHQKKTAEVYLMCAKIYFYNNDTENFHRAIAACLDIEPDYADALKLSSRSYMRENKFSQAKELLEKVTRSNSSDIEAELMLGETCEALKDYRGALLAYGHAETAYAYLERVHTRQAAIYKTLGADDRAHAATERAKHISSRSR